MSQDNSSRSCNPCPKCGVTARMTGNTLFLCKHLLEKIRATKPGRHPYEQYQYRIGDMTLIVVPQKKPAPPPKTLWQRFWDWLAPVMEDHP